MNYADAAAPRVLIVGSAPIEATYLRALASGFDTVICADGGGDALLGADILPAMVVGDMDSISTQARSRFADAGVAFQLHPTDKDKTDIELALDFARELQPANISIAGALGGMRLDHTIGNLLLLTLPALHDVEVRLVHESGEAFVVRGHSLLTGTPGDYVSLLPISERVEGVATRGMRYPLHGETLHRGSTRGVSNELTESSAWISVSGGLLLVCHERRVLM